jgi:hypothetical protein
MKLNTKQLRKQKNTVTISTKESLKDIEPYFIEKESNKYMKLMYELLYLILAILSFIVEGINSCLFLICLLFDKTDILIYKGQKKLMKKLNREDAR